MDADGRGYARMLGIVAGIVALLGGATALAATPVPSGRWSFVFNDPRGGADRPLRVFTYRPRQCDTTCPIVIVLHGAKRDAYPYMKIWGAIADERKVIVVGPQFDARHWPGAAAYNAGWYTMPEWRRDKGAGQGYKEPYPCSERAENFIKAATAAAGELGVRLAWELNEAPETASEARSVAEYAAQAVFGKR